MWKDINTLEPGDNKKQLLCAWKPSKDSHPMSYEVMILWPDGILTDTAEDEVLPGEMPDLYLEIQEIDSLKKDAARYRWLKQQETVTVRTTDKSFRKVLVLYDHSMDIAIDAIIKP
jgi:hypothetical protein